VDGEELTLVDSRCKAMAAAAKECGETYSMCWPTGRENTGKATRKYSRQRPAARADQNERDERLSAMPRKLVVRHHDVEKWRVASESQPDHSLSEVCGRVIELVALGLLQ
jgi:hypothetical protein